MSDRSVAFVPGEFFHVYNRGNSKQVIFKDEFDYQRFQILLYLSNSLESFKIENFRKAGTDFFLIDRGKPLVHIGAYCLMPNHYHLLLTPCTDNGVSLFMKKLGTGYSMFFNNRYERTGTLFEGKFKAQWADSDLYLKYLFSYIHLNPAKLIDHDWREHALTKTMVDFIEQYRFSSYWDMSHETKRREGRLLNLNAFPEYFNEREKITHVHDWFRARKDLALNSQDKSQSE